MPGLLRHCYFFNCTDVKFSDIMMPLITRLPPSILLIGDLVSGWYIGTAGAQRKRPCLKGDRQE